MTTPKDSLTKAVDIVSLINLSRSAVEFKTGKIIERKPVKIRYAFAMESIEYKLFELFFSEDESPFDLIKDSYYPNFLGHHKYQPFLDVYGFFIEMASNGFLEQETVRMLLNIERSIQDGKVIYNKIQSDDFKNYCIKLTNTTITDYYNAAQEGVTEYYEKEYDFDSASLDNIPFTSEFQIREDYKEGTWEHRMSLYFINAIELFFVDLLIRNQDAIDFLMKLPITEEGHLLVTEHETNSIREMKKNNQTNVEINSWVSRLENLEGIYYIDVDYFE